MTSLPESGTRSSSVPEGTHAELIAEQEAGPQIADLVQILRQRNVSANLIPNLSRGLGHVAFLWRRRVERYDGDLDHVRLVAEALAGALLSAGHAGADVPRIVEAVLDVGGLGEHRSEALSAVGQVQALRDSGKPAPGLPRLGELLYLDDEQVRELGLWLRCPITAASTFDLNPKGRPLGTPRNVRVAIAKMGVRLRFDDFAQQAMVEGLGDLGPELWDGAVDRLHLRALEDHGVRMPKDSFRSVVTDLALRDRSHPVCEHLDDLERRWDKIPRLDHWLSEFLGAEESDFVRAAGAKALIAAVRRVRSPGSKFDTMLVLEGRVQGRGKSTAISILAGRDEWFTDDLKLGMKSQQIIEATAGKWFVEVAELDGMARAEIENMKAQLSRKTDRARLAYEKFARNYPRQFVLIGTTNSEEYLMDATGNRRFWPVRTGKIDLRGLRSERDQLLAEAAHRERQGESVTLDPSLWQAAAAEQEARRTRDAWVDALERILGDEEGLISNSAAWDCVGMAVEKRTGNNSKRLADAMREIGWERSTKKLRFGGGAERFFFRGASEEKRALRVDRDGKVLGLVGVAGVAGVARLPNGAGSTTSRGSTDSPATAATETPDSHLSTGRTDGSGVAAPVAAPVAAQAERLHPEPKELGGHLYVMAPTMSGEATVSAGGR